MLPDHDADTTDTYAPTVTATDTPMGRGTPGGSLATRALPQARGIGTTLLINGVQMTLTRVSESDAGSGNVAVDCSINSYNPTDDWRQAGPANGVWLLYTGHSLYAPSDDEGDGGLLGPRNTGTTQLQFLIDVDENVGTLALSTGYFTTGGQELAWQFPAESPTS